MDYNPYDLVTVRIGGEEIHGRPFEFDSEPSNQQTMQNEFGGFVKPTHISTVCPKCGQGVIIDDIKLPDPPFPIIDWTCPNCNPGIEPQRDAFMNPLDAGRIADFNLDPLLHDPSRQIVVDDSEETVADRLGMEEDSNSETHTTSAMLAAPDEPAKKMVKKKAAKKKATKKTAKKKAKKTAKKHTTTKGAKMSSDVMVVQPEAHETPSLVTEKPTSQIEQAEGLAEEFDDSDLVE